MIHHVSMTAAMALHGVTWYDTGDGYWCSFKELVRTLGLKSLATANNGKNGSVHYLLVLPSTRMFVGRGCMDGLLAS